MSQQPDVSESLVELLRQLIKNLSGLEKLGLLSGSGKTLLSLCQEMIPSQSTGGLTQKVLTEMDKLMEEMKKPQPSDMYTYHQPLDTKELQRDLFNPWQRPSIWCQSRGLQAAIQQDMSAASVCNSWI